MCPLLATSTIQTMYPICFVFLLMGKFSFLYVNLLLGDDKAVGLECTLTCLVTVSTS